MKIVPPTDETIALAAQALQDSLLVGMPTETVYGIAANVFDPEAVEATFAAKGRPAENPLIVHVGSIDQARTVTADFSARAQMLAERFWPGPLTLVLPKSDRVPSIVTAGLDTVAVRMPNHPVALKLIRAAGPVSAPSANKFMGLSPTTAQMIDPQIEQRLEMILDGGACEVGIESTVLDLSGESPRILRPGAISKADLESVLGVEVGTGSDGERKSPGMYPKHYAPRSPVQIVEDLKPGQAGLILSSPNGPNQVVMPSVASEYARQLYQALFDMDRMRIGTIFIQSPPRSAEWDSVWDRLTKIVGS